MTVSKKVRTYKYDTENNCRWITGKLQYVSEKRHASTSDWCYIRVQDIVSNKMSIIQVWNYADVLLVQSLPIGTIVQVESYIHNYRRSKDSKVEYSNKAKRVVPYMDTYTVIGTINCEDAHIQRGKGNMAFSFKPELNGDKLTMYGILDKRSSLWNNIKKGQRVQIIGDIDESKKHQPIIHVRKLFSKDSNEVINK